MMSRRKVLITAALPYANGPLHFGHIVGAYLPADCYARFCRLRGDDVLYICGSDEYGVAITLSAEMAGRTPQEHVDLFHGINQQFFQKLGISFDHYSRTTWPGHHKTTQQFFLDLLANGFIEERETLQLYSPQEQRFLADRYVVGTCPKCGFEAARGDECSRCGASYEATDLKTPRSKLLGTSLEPRPTRHYFLLFDRFKDRLAPWLESKRWKPNVLHFARHYVDELRARAITRDGTWGVPVPLPGTEGKVLYVWFDAPIGYISATQEWAQLRGTPDAWKEYWLDPETRLAQFIGKDNIPFHAVFFPAMEMGQNTPYKLVDDLPANEFYHLEGRQFSKSDGWYIDLERFFTHFTAEQIRYTLAANAPETQDSEFSWSDFQSRCNAELLGKWGNFIHRVLVFARDRCDNLVPSLDGCNGEEKAFLGRIAACAQEIAQAYASFSLRKATQRMMELAQEGNVFFDFKKPWAKAKDPATRPEMERTVACCLHAIKTLALVSSPILPETAQRVWDMLAHPTPFSQVRWDAELASSLPAGHRLGAPHPLFLKVEDTQIQEELHHLQTLSGKDSTMTTTPAPSAPVALKPQVEFGDVQRLDLRVGLIEAAEPIPKSKKLLRLTVNLGFETRTVVAGIGASLTPEQIIGKKVIIVANLKPATLMGVESQGMLFAAGWDQHLELPGLQDAPLGSSIS